MSAMFPQIPWLDDWKRMTSVPMLAQRDYVRSELRRIAKAGAPVLTQALAAPLEMQTHLALSLLHEGALPQHRFIFRLVAGAKPPARDPQGRALGEEDVGKVLIAKTGTLGGQIQQSFLQPDQVTAEFNGPATQQAAWAGRDIYQYVRITAEPSDVPLGQAVIMLRRYGHGLARPRYMGRSKRVDENGKPNERDAHGHLVQEMDFWLVEEIPPQFVGFDGKVRDPRAEAEAALEAATRPARK